MSKNFDLYLEATISICPQCLKQIQAKIVQRKNEIYLEKNCPVHGLQYELMEEDAEYFKHRKEFDKPGTPCATQTNVRNGCPFDCGLCPQHAQHTCIGLIEVTNACDLKCPVCYARSGQTTFLDLKTIERMMDLYVSSELDQPEILQISGGEPTLHPQILDIIRLARKKKFKYVMLNTNGLRIAHDEDFVRELASFKGGFEVYLQFDSFQNRTLKKLRGRAIHAEKERAILLLSQYHIPATLVTTVAHGMNDGELGKIVQLGLDTPGIRGVNFQPVAFFGRLPSGFASRKRTTLTGIIRKLEAQTKGLLRMSDFVPLPCNVDRVSLTYLRKAVNGKWIPLPREVDIKKFVPAIKNTFAFSLEDALSPSCCTLLSSPKKLLHLLADAKALQSIRKRATYLDENLFRISITSFIDIYNFDLKSMQKECVHIITPDLRKIPFSAYNMFHRPS